MNPSAAQYQQLTQVPGGKVTTTSISPPPPPVDHGGTFGTLPFTGYDAVVLGLVAMALIATGAVMKRLSRQRQN